MEGAGPNVERSDKDNDDIEIDKEVMSTKDSTGEIEVETKVKNGNSCSTNLT